MKLKPSEENSWAITYIFPLKFLNLTNFFSYLMDDAGAGVPEAEAVLAAGRLQELVNFLVRLFRVGQVLVSPHLSTVDNISEQSRNLAKGSRGVVICHAEPSFLYNP